MKPLWIIGTLLGGYSLLACHQLVTTESSTGDMQLGMYASVIQAEGTRTIIENGHTQFISGDEIGFFMPGESKPVCWVYQGEGNWESEVLLYWPDKETVFEFSAFYPYKKEAIRGRIPMPDLRAQKGRWEELGHYDFLLAKASSSYNTSLDGKVAFVDHSAFKHLYSLIVITLKYEYENVKPSPIVLKKVCFEGDDIVTAHYYDLDVGEMCPVTASEEGSLLEWEVSPEEGAIKVPGIQLALLINPSEVERRIKFSILYEKEGERYRAETSAIYALFSPGKLYKYGIKIKEEGLTLEGNTIIDWEEGINIGDIIIDCMQIRP